MFVPFRVVWHEVKVNSPAVGKLYRNCLIGPPLIPSITVVDGVGPTGQSIAILL